MIGLANFSVTVTGGKYAGEYSGGITDGLVCANSQLGGGSSFTVAGMRLDPSGPLSQIVIEVRDVAGAAAGTKQFDATFSFGGNAYVLEIADFLEGSSGTATLTAAGGHRVLTVDGTTPEGVKVLTQITCR